MNKERDDKRLNIHVSQPLHKALRMKAAEDDVTIQRLVEKALRQLVGLPEDEEGRKGGTVYPSGGVSALRFADGQR